MVESDQQRRVRELRRCSEALGDASKRDWPRLQHVATYVCEWADRAASVLFEVLQDGTVPGYESAARCMFGAGDLATRTIGWSINLWSTMLLPIFGPSDRGGYHISAVRTDSSGRVLGTNDKPLRAAKHRDGSSELVGREFSESALGPIHEYDEMDAIEHWRRRAAGCAEACEAAAGLMYPVEETNNWSPPQSPGDWSKVFKVKAKTFVRLVRKGKIRAKMLTTKSYQVHVDDVPRVDRRGDRRGS